MEAPDTLKLHQLYQISLRELSGNSPNFANHAVVYLFEERARLLRDIDKALQEKAMLSFSKDITETKLKSLVDNGERMPDNKNTLDCKGEVK